VEIKNISPSRVNRPDEGALTLQLLHLDRAPAPPLRQLGLDPLQVLLVSSDPSRRVMRPMRSEQLITVLALQERLNEPGHDVGHSLSGLPRHLLAAGAVAAEDAQPAAPVVFFISQVRQRLVGVEDRATRQLDPVDDRSAGQLPRTPEEDVVGPAAVDDLDPLGVAVVGIAVRPERHGEDPDLVHVELDSPPVGRGSGEGDGPAGVTVHRWSPPGIACCEP
jgi:hypothetical protein